MCPVQEPCLYVKGQVHSLHLGMVWYRDPLVHTSHQGAILLKALGGGVSVLSTHLFSSIGVYNGKAAKYANIVGNCISLLFLPSTKNINRSIKQISICESLIFSEKGCY